MAENDIIQNMIYQLGQSQDGRMPKELGIHFADVDERTTEDHLLFTKKLAEFVNYYRNTVFAPADDWTWFFPFNESSSDFYASEFNDLLTIKGLCDAITADSYGLSLKSPANTIDWLNELLKITDFYDKLYNKKPNYVFPKDINGLIERTKNYRSKSFTELFHGEQNNIKRFNRLLLEEIYQDETPKSHIENTVTQLVESKDAGTSPHIVLFLAFLELYKRPQEVINRITGRHLDFYYKDVLRLTKKAPVPDKAHVLLELKKNVLPVGISPEHLFSAGKDAMGVELVYAPTRKTVINASKVDSLRSVFLDKSGILRYAPIANSSDGVGGELKGDKTGWYGFGHEGLPRAEVGFAIASPVLRMKEGKRTVTVTLTLSNIASLKNADNNTIPLKTLINIPIGEFEIYITGEKNWLGPYSIYPKYRFGNILQFNFDVPESEKAVIDYDAAIHGYSYNTQMPVMQVLLKGDSMISYNNFNGITICKAKVAVDVSNITSLSLESDAGLLDPKKAFLPFGPQPTVGSRFMVGYAEALSKKLSEVKITVKWKGTPSSFSIHYAGYIEESQPGYILLKATSSNISTKAPVAHSSIKPHNDYFTAAVSFKDGGSWKYSSTGEHLFVHDDASLERTITFPDGTPSVSSAIPREGFITFSLEQDFLHAIYRKKYVENVMTFSKQEADTPHLVLLNEPYTPAIQSISLSYKASSDEVDISSTSLDHFSNNDLQFYHICFINDKVKYFGQMRLTGKSVSLLPVYSNEGELIIGFKDLHAGDSVSVLFQVAEGSDDPDMEQVDISWFVLCDNYWRPLDSSGVVLDTTNQLLASGTITFVIPAEATENNTILPSGRIWIKAAVPQAAVGQNVKAVCRLIEISANAVEVQFVDKGNNPSHLLTALGKGSISKFRNGLSAVKSIRQPYASFGGRAVESDDAFYTRVSERLRHKNRCITAWDYERIILEAFSKVHKVKCIPHANGDRWLVPGNLLIVVIPDMKNKNAMDPLQPKVDANTISRITSYIQERTGTQVKVKVKNPSYQKVQLDFKVKFYDKYEFNYYSEQLKQELIQFLSPWAFKTNYDIFFGGKVYKSVVLDFVEEREYVDYITDFRMYTYTETASTSDMNVAQPERPDAILVSAETHKINKTET